MHKHGAGAAHVQMPASPYTQPAAAASVESHLLELYISLSQLQQHMVIKTM
jgi:hypothetical protein